MTSAARKLADIIGWVINGIVFLVILYVGTHYELVHAAPVQVELYTFSSSSIALVVDEKDVPFVKSLPPKMVDYCLEEMEADREGESIPFAKELLLCASAPHHLTFESRQY